MLKLTTTLHTNYVHTSARKANSINLDHKTLYITWLFSDARILDSYRLRNNQDQLSATRKGGYVCMYVHMYVYPIWLSHTYRAYGVDRSSSLSGGRPFRFPLLGACTA